MDKFFITRTIDLNRLNSKIYEYICKTNEENPYIFMNRNTINAIPNADTPIRYLNQIPVKVNGIVGYYQGYKVFEDNTLEFGEVEIR